MVDQKISLNTKDGFRIIGMHTRSTAKAIVVWLHGITGNKDEWLGFFSDGADYLSRRGIDSLRIDFRGHGQSSGKPTDFSIIGQIHDVESLISYLHKTYDDKLKPVVLVGCSFGAPAAIFSAHLYPDVVKALVLVAPVLSYKKTFLEAQSEWAKSIFNEESMKDLEKTDRMNFDEDFGISSKLVTEMKLISPEPILAKLSHPVTVIHGKKDLMVPYQITQEVLEDLSNVRLITMPDMDHGFTKPGDESGDDPKSQENKKQIYEEIARACLEG